MRSPRRCTAIKADAQVKFQILKELNQASLGEINAIYADLNRHCTNLHVMPAAACGSMGARAGRPRAPAKQAAREGRAAAPAEST